MQISNGLIEVVLNYLATRPYQEVVGLINTIIQESNNQPKDQVAEEKPVEEEALSEPKE